MKHNVAIGVTAIGVILVSACRRDEPQIERRMMRPYAHDDIVGEWEGSGNQYGGVCRMMLLNDGTGVMTYRSTSWPTVTCHRFTWSVTNHSFRAMLEPGNEWARRYVGTISDGWVASNEYREASEMLITLKPASSPDKVFMLHKANLLKGMRDETQVVFEECLLRHRRNSGQNDKNRTRVAISTNHSARWTEAP